MTTDELNAGAAAKALDDIGELIDQLAGSAREFDFNTANRMERDAAKALLIIEGAINALPELIESARRVEEMQAALKTIDRFSLIIEVGVRNTEPQFQPEIVAGLLKARAALKGT
jgi:hypothetical protein